LDFEDSAESSNDSAQEGINVNGIIKQVVAARVAMVAVEGPIAISDSEPDIAAPHARAEPGKPSTQTMAPATGKVDPLPPASRKAQRRELPRVALPDYHASIVESAMEEEPLELRRRAPKARAEGKPKTAKATTVQAKAAKTKAAKAKAAKAKAAKAKAAKAKAAKARAKATEAKAMSDKAMAKPGTAKGATRPEAAATPTTPSLAAKRAYRLIHAAGRTYITSRDGNTAKWQLVVEVSAKMSVDHATIVEGILQRLEGDPGLGKADALELRRVALAQ
jgi:hypothetical protein